MTIHEPAERPRTANHSLDFHPGMGMRWEITLGRMLRFRLEP